MLQIWFHIINLYTSIRSTTKWNKKKPTDKFSAYLLTKQTSAETSNRAVKKRLLILDDEKEFFDCYLSLRFKIFPSIRHANTEKTKKKEEKLFSQRDTNEIFHVEWRWRKKLKHHSCVELSERQDEATKLCLPLRLFILSFICRLTMT